MRFTLYIPCLWQLGFVPHFDGYGCRVVLPLFIFLAICGLLSLSVNRQASYNEEFLPTEMQPSVQGMSRLRTLELGADLNHTGWSLHYAVIIDCGSSGSRVYLYCWPPHTGKMNQLLNIQPVRGVDGKPLIKKIEPGISSTVRNPSKAAEYLQPLLDYAKSAVPEIKHRETPLYVLATAGMRMLTQRDRQLLLTSLRSDIPKFCNFLFSETNVDVISGKQEAIYAWISINYALGRFDHDVSSDDQLSLVELPGLEAKVHVRKKTVGILDMGGGSLQIAMEVPRYLCWDTAKHNIAKELVSEFSLGCTQDDLDHTYCVYINTFLNYGSNSARTLYKQLYFNNVTSDKANNGSRVPLIVSDPCLPIDFREQIMPASGEQMVTLQGTGVYDDCKNRLRHLLNFSTPCSDEQCTLDGVYMPEIDFKHTQFYGFAEFFYTMEDLLHIGGKYNYRKFQSFARAFCNREWSELEKWQEQNKHPRADQNRYRLQCFKSAWMTTVLHEGLKFPVNYDLLTSVQYINGEEVHWALGAILYKTRYFPLREFQKLKIQHYKPPWMLVKLHYANYIVVLCFLIVLAAILIYVRRLHPWKREMYRVPTMSYFMTEEGQAEEGLHVAGFDNKYFDVHYS